MIGDDPRAVVIGALEAKGCEPEDNRARCPAHDDTDPSLGIGEGSDGRVLLFCRTGCTIAEIVAALGLTMRDLHRPGHRHGHRPSRPGVAATQTYNRDVVPGRPPGALLLENLSAAGLQWAATVVLACPFCGAPCAHITAGVRGRIEASCTEGCSGDEMLRAIDCRAEIALLRADRADESQQRRLVALIRQHAIPEDVARGLFKEITGRVLAGKFARSLSREEADRMLELITTRYALARSLAGLSRPSRRIERTAA